jgi:heat shock protein 4
MQAALAQTADAVLLSADITKKMDAMQRFAKPIMTRAKPAPVKVEEPAAEPAPEAGAYTRSLLSST